MWIFKSRAEKLAEIKRSKKHDKLIELYTNKENKFFDDLVKCVKELKLNKVRIQIMSENCNRQIDDSLYWQCDNGYFINPSSFEPVEMLDYDMLYNNYNISDSFIEYLNKFKDKEIFICIESVVSDNNRFNFAHLHCKIYDKDHQRPK